KDEFCLHPKLLIAASARRGWIYTPTESAKPDGSWGWVSAVVCEGRTIWIADAHRDNGKRFVARVDEKRTAFLKLESAIRACGQLSRQAGEI
ncbi:MAG TPA: hypothetical protein VIG87_04865, partial [Candidatus Udaeobacter sp.]